MSYSGMEKIGETTKHFVGEDIKEIKGENWYKFFKIKCSNCGSEGEDLEHKNWFTSKEVGEDLYIKCKKCGSEINTDNEKEFSKWKITIPFWDRIR